MAKRKADELPQQVLTNRRRTRSSGPLDLQPVLPPIKRRRRTTLPVTSTLDVEENTVKEANCNADEVSEDDLNLLSSSPSKDKSRFLTPKPSDSPKSIKRTPRQVMDAVVITTPKSLSRTPRRYLTSVPASPSPSRAARNTIQTSPVSYSNDKLLHVTPRGSRRLLFPAIVPSSPTSSSLFDSSPARTVSSSSPLRSAATTSRLPRPLPAPLIPHLHTQKKSVLYALQNPPQVVYDSTPHPSAFDQLEELVKGTTQRHEGNSCLILGPKGSGKSRLVDRALASTASTSTNTPVIVRLSAHCQINDRMAMREIARQVHQQTGTSSLPGSNTDEDEGSDEDEDYDETKVVLPPSSRLPSMIAALPGLGRPVIVILDGFDGFAAHPRQALLYCLLDTVQSCNPTPVKAGDQHVDLSTDHTGQKSHPPRIDDIVADEEDEVSNRMQVKGGHGLLVIGITSRVDCLTLLEKRVKSRFSHRIMRVGTPSGLNDLLKFLEAVLDIEVDGECPTAEEWKHWWKTSVKEFLSDKSVLNIMKEAFAFGKDLRMILRLLIAPVISLTPSSPWLIASNLAASVSIQRCPKQFPFLTALPYPHVALLIAAAHTEAAGHDVFNFEILHDKFVTQVRVSASAPVQAAGGGLGMVNVSRGVMLASFEQLVASHVFRPVAAPSTHVTKEFVKYRCIAGREDIKAAVEQLGQTNLKKWFTRNQ